KEGGEEVADRFHAGRRPRAAARRDVSAAEDRRWMEESLREARAAGARGEVPIGAVVVRDGLLLARAGNASIAEADPTGHAEVRAVVQGFFRARRARAR